MYQHGTNESTDNKGLLTQRLNKHEIIREFLRQKNKGINSCVKKALGRQIGSCLAKISFFHSLRQIFMEANLPDR